MDYSSMFSMLGSRSNPYDEQSIPPESFSGPISSQYQPTFQENPRPLSWEEAFNGFKTRPVLYNMDGFISPYSCNNWGGTSNILQYIDESYRVPGNEAKIDPNKIFSSEVNGLRAIEADQAKMLKMFERKLVESLTEKGKVGLTEEDINAMAAINSARSTLAGIEREKVNIKKNIADIKIKQAQNGNGSGNGTGTGSAGSNVSSFDVGRSIMDNIFDIPGGSSSGSVQSDIPVTSVEYTAANVDAAASIVDAVVADADINGRLKFEHQEPTTYVVVGDTDDDVEYVTYSSDGDIIPDYPKPNTPIAKIDRESHTATDTLLVSYPLKER